MFMIIPSGYKIPGGEMDLSWMWDTGRVTMFLPYCPKYGDVVKYEGKDAIVLEAEDLEEWKDMFPIRYRVSVINPKIKEKYLKNVYKRVGNKWMTLKEYYEGK